MLWFRVPDKIYFKYGCLQEALHDLGEDGRKRLIVTDRYLYNTGLHGDLVVALRR